MKKSVAIIGAGFTGLSAAWELVNAGYEVTVFEGAKVPGGLASGFQEKEWDWSLENHYHHVFETDTDIQQILEEMGLRDLLFYLDTKSLVQYQGQRYQLDSPLSLLQFSPISFWARIRTGMVLAFLKFFPKGIWLEKFTAETFLRKTMGEEAWRVIWQPLFMGKFGRFASKVNMAWFWARIYARSKKLGYFKGGFFHLAQEMVRVLEERGVKFEFGARVRKFNVQRSTFSVETGDKRTNTFSKVLVTTSSFIFSKMVLDLPKRYLKNISRLKGLGAMTLVLELEKPFFDDETYWLNINEKDWPFLAVVEHTHFVDQKHYAKKSLVYVGKYLETNSEQFAMDKKDLLKLYAPYLKKLSPNFQKLLKRTWLYKESFAQPIVEKNHSQYLPKMVTPISNLYWASMQHVYPWDRGTNFAVKIGRVAASLVQRS